MQCLACGADNKMLLMDVVQDDTMKVPVIERQIYMCSACRHIARRLVFRRAKMPITHLPVIPTSIDKLWKERVAGASLVVVDCECHVRRFFLKTQPRLGAAFFCAARLPASRERRTSRPVT